MVIETNYYLGCRNWSNFPTLAVRGQHAYARMNTSEIPTVQPACCQRASFFSNYESFLPSDMWTINTILQQTDSFGWTSVLPNQSILQTAKSQRFLVLFWLCNMNLFSNEHLLYIDSWQKSTFYLCISRNSYNDDNLTFECPVYTSVYFRHLPPLLSSFQTQVFISQSVTG